jgi:hypothetical protein
MEDKVILGNQNIAAWKGSCLALSKQVRFTIELFIKIGVC